MRDGVSAADWPALAGDIPDRVRVRRAVWGKLPGRREDFGWIARSADFDRTGVRVEHKLALGAEDSPRGRACFWLARERDRACFAVSCYPSGVEDAFGRTGLEKQFLEWERDGSAAAAALLLLPLVETFKPEGWLRADANGQMLRGGAVIEAATCPEVDVRATLPGRIEEARAALRSAVKADALAEMYTALLNGRQPAFLTGVSHPLPAPALAALLLPLDRRIADRVSMAAWIVSRNFDDAMRATWNLVVCDQIPLSLGGRKLDVSSEAQRLAATVLGDDGGSPKALTSTVSAASVVGPDLRPATPEIPPPPLAEIPPPPPGPTRGSVTVMPGSVPATSDERGEVSTVIEEIEHFAHSPSRAWPDRDRPSPRPARVSLTPAQRDRVIECVRFVRAQLDTAIPDLRGHKSLYEARRAHLEYKVGLIRQVVEALDATTARNLDSELRWSSPGPAASRETSWSSSETTRPTVAPPAAAPARPAPDDRRQITALIVAIERLALSPSSTWPAPPPRLTAPIELTAEERERVKDAVDIVTAHGGEVGRDPQWHTSAAGVRHRQAERKLALIREALEAVAPGVYAGLIYGRRSLTRS